MLPIIRANKLFPIFYDFGSGGGKAKTQTIADPYGKLRDPFINDLVSKVGKPGPEYTGELTAPMSEQERASLSKVSAYANQAPNSTLQAGKAQIERTLNGGYDPASSPYYQAVKAQAAQNLTDTNRRIASTAGGGGRYYTGARIKAQSDATRDVNLGLDKIIGDLSQQERQNQLAVLPQALSFATEENNLPLQQATALQTLGALPRTLQQNTDTTQLNNWFRSQYDYPLNWAQLISGVQTPPTVMATPQNSGLQNVTQGLTQGAMLALMMAGK